MLAVAVGTATPAIDVENEDVPVDEKFEALKPPGLADVHVVCHRVGPSIYA